MYHNLPENPEKRIEIWLELCDFTYKLLKDALSPEEFKKRLEWMRKDHLGRDYKILDKLASIK